jgi:putative FmdB family regulatory protein
VPTYDYSCQVCQRTQESFIRLADLDQPVSCVCGAVMHRMVSAPLFKFAGRVTPGGGPDRFTADMLGIPLKELPEGLKSGG